MKVRRPGALKASAEAGSQKGTVLREVRVRTLTTVNIKEKEIDRSLQRQSRRKEEALRSRLSLKERGNRAKRTLKATASMAISASSCTTRPARSGKRITAVSSEINAYFPIAKLLL